MGRPRQMAKEASPPTRGCPRPRSRGRALSVRCRQSDQPAASPTRRRGAPQLGDLLGEASGGHRTQANWRVGTSGPLRGGSGPRDSSFVESPRKRRAVPGPSAQALQLVGACVLALIAEGGPAQGPDHLHEPVAALGHARASPAKPLARRSASEGSDFRRLRRESPRCRGAPPPAPRPTLRWRVSPAP